MVPVTAWHCSVTTRLQTNLRPWHWSVRRDQCNLGLEPQLGRALRLGGRIRQTILNSDARLDFGNSVPELTAGLASAASIPLCIEDQLVGVLTIYSSTPAGYTEQHLKLLHVVAPRLATALASSRIFDEHATAHLWDGDTGLPNDRYLRDISRHLFRGIGASIRSSCSDRPD